MLQAFSVHRSSKNQTVTKIERCLKKKHVNGDKRIYHLYVFFFIKKLQENIDMNAEFKLSLTISFFNHIFLLLNLND